MNLMSMTGYGRAEGRFEDWSWVWEVRAVNGKSLDMRLRLPAGFESYEVKLRKAAARSLQRGNLQISLNLHSDIGASGQTINHNWLRVLLEDGAQHVEKYGLESGSLGDLYLVKGVIEDSIETASDPKFEARNQAIMSSFEDMLSALREARRAEGQELEGIMNTCVSSFQSLTAAAKKRADSQPVQIKEKLLARVSELIGEHISEEKLILEVSLLATKADVREELDRLEAHISQAGTLLKQNGAIGRKLDFLSQEFIREINTLCSKSSDIELTRIGLEMKSLIEQFREQAANVE